MRIGIILALIDLTCRHAVAEHFFDVARGHFDGLVHFGDGVDVIPIFKVVAVAPLVVHPRIRATKELALALVGASISLIVARAGDKLGGRIFGEVVKKPLPANACAKAMPNNAMAMARDGAKMQNRMCHNFSPLSCFLYYSTFLGKVNTKGKDISMCILLLKNQRMSTELAMVFCFIVRFATNCTLNKLVFPLGQNNGLCGAVQMENLIPYLVCL